MKRLVVVGNGMAGMACVEQILKHAPQFDITVFGDETHVNYNRILLSSVLAGEKAADDIVHQPARVVSAQRDRPARRRAHRRRRSGGEDGHRRRRQRHAVRHAAAGHRQLGVDAADRRPRQGRRLRVPHARRHARAAASAPGPGTKAVVIGGGLLGLEAARGLQVQGCDVTVVHLMATLMERQLDPDGGQLPASARWRSSASACCSGARTTAILGNGHVEGVALSDGEHARRRPRRRRRRHPAERRARRCKAGLARQPRHRRQRLHGDVRPRHLRGRRVRRAPRRLLRPGGAALRAGQGAGGDDHRQSRARPTPAPCRRRSSRSWASTSSRPATGASRTPSRCASRTARSASTRSSTVRDGKLAGVILVGDTSDSHRYMDWLRTGADSAGQRRHLLFPPPAADAGLDVARDGRQRDRLRLRRRDQGHDHRRRSTSRASTRCRSSRSARARAPAAAAAPACARTCCARSRRSSRTRSKKVICACVPFAEDKLRDILRSQKLKSVQEVLEIYGNGIGCEVCKPALSYMLDMLWCGDHDEDRSARFINDRVHANIQKDGTFSVVPRIRGGVTSPDELRRIADVADKYQVPMVKITGSQRIDLLGHQEGGPAEGVGRPRHAVGPGVHQGRAHGEDLRRHRVLPLRHAGLDRRRHRDGAPLRAALHAAQGEDGRRRLSAQLRRGDGEGHRPHRRRGRLAGGRRRRGRQVACARPTC